jgi:hypothetical protein
LLSAPDILAGMATITFDAEPDVADHLEKLCRITNLGAGELINILLGPPLRQIIKDKDSGFLQCCVQPFVYGTKEEALDIIARYESFISEDGSGCYHPDAKPRRTRGGDWEVVFKSTHPWDEGEARYQ